MHMVSLLQSYIPPGDRCLVSKGSTVIEDNVWLGDNVSILPGVHVGKRLYCWNKFSRDKKCTSLLCGWRDTCKKY